MEQRGWWIRSYPEESDFWEAMQEKGGWWDPGLAHGLWGKLFQTPSHKYEFYSKRLEDWMSNLDLEKLDASQVARVADLRANGSVACLPYYEAPRYQGEPGDDALILNVMHPMTPNTAVTAALPWVREVISGRLAWETWVEIHPKDAERRDIHDRALVLIRAGNREIPARARVSNRVREGLVSVPHGLGRPAGGRWARLRGTNPGVLAGRNLNYLSGMRETQSMRVTISSAKEGVTHA